MADSDRTILQERDKQFPEIAEALSKGKLLDEMEMVTVLHRKRLTHLMGFVIRRKPRQGRRGPTYDPQVEYALRVDLRAAWITSVPSA